MRIAADIGGTHARFAAVDPSGEASAPRRFACGAFPDPAALLAAAIAEFDDGTPVERIVLAAAGPLEADRLQLVNRDWLLEAAALGSALGCEVRLANDFEALACGVLHLPPESLVFLGGPEAPAATGPVGVIGPGTGLGTALVDPVSGRVWPGEGGHAALAPHDDRQARVLDVLRARHGRVSRERVLSGPGLAHLDAVLAGLDGRAEAGLDAPGILAAAAAGDPHRIATLEVFEHWLGATVGDFALGTGARRIFLGGGLAIGLRERLARGPFRTALEAKGRLAHWARGVRVDLIDDDLAGLRGAARIAAEP